MIRRDKKDTLRKAIAQGEKYKLYLYAGVVYTKQNQFVKFFPHDICVFIMENRELFYKSKKNRKGHKALDELIESPHIFKDKYGYKEDELLEEVLKSIKF